MTPLQKHRRGVAIAWVFFTLAAIAVALASFIAGVKVGTAFGLDAIFYLRRNF
jgi:hypothetical protein